MGEYSILFDKGKYKGMIYTFYGIDVTEEWLSGYCFAKSLGKGKKILYIGNDRFCEGLSHRADTVIRVQFEPSANPKIKYLRDLRPENTLTLYLNLAREGFTPDVIASAHYDISGLLKHWEKWKGRVITPGSNVVFPWDPQTYDSDIVVNIPGPSEILASFEK